MRLERDQYDALVEAGAPPVLDAGNGADVEQQLGRLYRDPSLARDVGRRTREWFLAAQSSRRWSDTYRVLLQAMAAGIPLSTDASPLREPLSEKELELTPHSLLQLRLFRTTLTPRRVWLEWSRL